MNKMSEKNRQRKFRRAQVQQNPKGKVQQPKPFSQNEQRIIADLKGIGGIAKTNQNSIVNLQTDVNDLGSQLNLLNHQIEIYDKQTVQPRLDALEAQNIVLTEILLLVSDQIEIKISEEDMKILGLEAIEQDAVELVKELEKEEEIQKIDSIPKVEITDKDVVAPSSTPLPKKTEKKATKKKVKAKPNVEN